jgi:hypothetical protein
MVDFNLLSLARDLRARAQEILARAETIYDTDAEQTMREVAARHEKLPQRVEQGPVRQECEEGLLRRIGKEASNIRAAAGRAHLP